MIGKIALILAALVAVQGSQLPEFNEITVRAGFIEDIKNVIHNIEESIKNFNQHILKAINDFINDIKNALKANHESKIEKMIDDRIQQEFGTERKFILFCIEEAKVKVQKLANDTVDIFKGCGADSLKVGKDLVDETKALIKQSLDLVGHCTLEFGKCLFDVLHYDACFKGAIADAQKRAADIKQAGDQLGVDIKTKVPEAAEAFRVCWRGGYDFLEAGIKQIIQDIKTCAGIQ